MPEGFVLHDELRAWLEEYRRHRAFNPKLWIEEKCNKLNEYMRVNNLKGCVTNVSGGVDSAVVLMLCSRAQRMEESPITKNVGICQPICSSSWALERGLENIRASGAEEVVVNQTSIHSQLSREVESAIGVEGRDFTRGQLRSYMRTPVVYYAAQLYGQGGTPTIVMGTGNMDEDGYLGYFCKAGDGVVDVQLISDLHKSEVFRVARELGVPANTLEAPPSADLWDGQTDEEELGFPYDFVELYTGWFVKLNSEEQETRKRSLSVEALRQFEAYVTRCEETHRRNAHKLKGVEESPRERRARDDLVMGAVAAMERQRELSAQSNIAACEYENDGSLGTYLRIKAEGQYKAPTRSTSSWSGQSTLCELNDCSCGYGNHGITETASDICSQGGDKYGPFHSACDAYSTHSKNQSHRVSVHRLGVGSLKMRGEQLSVEKSFLHRNSAPANETRWSDSLHMDVEQLDMELGQAVRADPSFSPSLLRHFRGIPCAASDEYEECSSRRRRTVENHSVCTDVLAGGESSRESSVQSRGGGEPLTIAATRWNNYLAQGEGTIEVSGVLHSGEEDGASGVSSIQQRGNLLLERRQRTKDKWQTKELEECTFCPRLSRTSVSMFQKKSQSRDSVFRRLYHSHLTCKDAEEESQCSMRKLVLIEKDQLRELSGATTSEEAGSDSFELFMLNVLGSKEERRAAFVHTTYQSPLARKLEAAKLEAAFERVTSGDVSHPEAHNGRSASFDNFLVRQNMHVVNRTRIVREIEKAQRPSFKPQITNTSVRIAKKLRARAEDGTTSVGCTSTLATAVKKHRSPYVDPCTFKPHTAPGSSGAKPSGAEAMFLESVRRRNAMKAAREKALSAEMKHPFRPTLNDERNANVESYLSSKHLSAYTEILKKKREKMAEMREEQERERELKLAEQSTFRPKTSRVPAYIRQMASSFALVRQQCEDT